MNSGGHRGFTVVTIVTLIFAPIFSHHHWMWRLVGKTKETHIEQCVVKQPCPHHKRIVKIVTLPQPPAPPPPPRGRKHSDSNNNNNSNSNSNDDNDNDNGAMDNPWGFDVGNYGNDDQDHQNRH
jgi:hypothetical protein